MKSRMKRKQLINSNKIQFVVKCFSLKKTPKKSFPLIKTRKFSFLGNLNAQLGDCLTSFSALNVPQFFYLR